MTIDKNVFKQHQREMEILVEVVKAKKLKIENLDETQIGLLRLFVRSARKFIKDNKDKDEYREGELSKAFVEYQELIDYINQELKKLKNLKIN